MSTDQPTPEPTAPEQPEQIGPYKIDATLGAGGMGTVYRGRHIETGQVAAVKVLPASMSREEGFVLRFNREIESLKKLSNPHIVELYESGADGETYYYAMEYVDGETLMDRLKHEKRIAWRDAVEIAIQICRALKAAHNTGIIHRDLKPSNLILNGEGQVKLADFGVAQVFAAGRLTVTGGIIGTAEFMSPEQAEGKRATKVSDLYSLGAVLYAMLTGRPPFRGRTTVDVIQKQKFGQFDLPSRYVPEIPHQLEEIVCQLLEKEPDKRYPDAYVLSLRLQEVLKREQLLVEDRTMAFGDGPSPASEVAPTVAAQAAPDAVGGTLMRDLLRAEIDKAHQASPVESLLNNTWVLVGIFVLLVGGAYYALPREEGGRVTETEVVAEGETERFLDLARHYQRLGDYGRAEQILTSLADLLAGDEDQQEMRDRVQQRLKLLRKRREIDAEESDLAADAMQRATDLLEQGETEQARRIWQAVGALYADDPQSQDIVHEARTRIEELGTDDE